MRFIHQASVKEEYLKNTIFRSYFACFDKRSPSLSLKAKKLSMKLVCAWCKRVIRDGPEKTVSHGICPKCEGWVGSQRGHSGPCPGGDLPRRFQVKLFLSLAMSLLLGLALLISEGLHFVSGGKIPRFMPWSTTLSSKTSGKAAGHLR